MAPAENYDFEIEKQRAAARLRELGARSKYRQNPPPKMPPAPPPPADAPQDFKLPFLSSISTDSDMALILGLVLILGSENADKLLLLALLYILI